MAEDGKQGTNLTSSGIVLAALIATGAFVFHKEAPLTASRPVSAEAVVQERAETQTVDARLWQDPFAAVAKATDKLSKDQQGQQCRNTSNPEKVCLSPLTARDKDALVIGVTLSDAPYAEDAEQRRRTRYAVLSGLERAGFVPRDARHIGYFWLRENSRISLTKDAVLANALLRPLPQPLTDQQLPFFSSSRLSLIDKLSLIPTEPAAESPAQSVPYEWFDEMFKNQDKDQRKSVLVVWLQEESLKHRPLQKILDLKTFLNLQNGQRLKIVGPYTSGILLDMVKEACPFVEEIETHHCDRGAEKIDPLFLKDVQFYPYGASAPDEHILSGADGTVEKYFAKLNIQLQRMVGTDNILAQGISKELELRNVKIGSDLVKGNGDLVLVSEWDSFYGQTLPKAVEAQFEENKCKDGTFCFIHKLTYLRGLDGLTPTSGGVEERKQDKTAVPDNKQADAANFFKTQTGPDTMDRPVGQGQFDYLRRMSRELHKTDDELRKKGRRIKAIGVLGSDVFDKLLVLRALRPEFPEALFFTTDFDEAYTVGSELPWTRNLIIASSFGSKLDDKIQQEIPSFRNSYQTAAFLATLSAVGDPAKNWITPKHVLSAIDKQLKTPRIFEISRSGETLAFKSTKNFVSDPSPKVPGQKQEECLECEDKIAAVGLLMQGRSEANGEAVEFAKSCAENPHRWDCTINQLQPDDEKLFPTFDEDGRRLLVRGLAAGAFLGLILLWFGKIPVNARFESSIVTAGLSVGALTAYYWTEFAEFVTSHGEGEPIAILEGVSVWPTVLLRLLGIIVSVYFIWRAQDSLQKNLAEIASEMKLPLADDAVPPRHMKQTWHRRTVGVLLSIRDRVSSIFDFSLGQSKESHNISIKVETAWKTYIRQERFWSRRVLRASLYTLLMFGFFWYVLSPMLGHPTTPARGMIAFYAYIWTTKFDVVLMLFLTFVIFDATCFCLLFVNKLRRSKTEWPIKTREDFKKRLRLQTDLIHDWIDLEFVAKRTRCIGWLIYYPFILIALLILSRTTVFANYPPSPTILVGQGISLSIVLVCAVMLWWAATAARDAAKQNLTDEIIWAKGPCAMVYVLDAAITKTDLPASGVTQFASPVIDAGNPARASTDPSPQKGADDNPRYAEQLETLLSRVEQLRDGAFGPFTQQPLVRAVIFPITSFGWTTLLESGLLRGL